MLRRLHEELAAANVDFKIVEAHGPVREILRAEGLEELVGAITRHASLAELLEKNDVTTSAGQQWLHWPSVTILKTNPHQGTHHEH